MAQIWELHNNGFINYCSDLTIWYFVGIIQTAERWRSEVTYWVLKDPCPSSVISGLRAYCLPHMPRSHTLPWRWLLAKWKKEHKVIIGRETTPHYQDVGDGTSSILNSEPTLHNYLPTLWWLFRLPMWIQYSPDQSGGSVWRVVPKAAAGASFG